MGKPRKPRQPGQISWKLLAAKSDAEVIAYFMQVEGKDAVHAKNSCRFLRRLYVWDAERNDWVRTQDGRRPRRARNSMTYTPKPEAEGPQVDLSDLKSPTQAELQAELDALDRADEQKARNAEKVRQVKADHNADAPAPDDAMQALALALAPQLAKIMGDALAKTVDARIKAALDEALANFQPKHDDKAPKPGQIIVMEPKKAPRLLEGLHHHQAAKVTRLAAQGLNVMMVGPAGSGKTMIAQSVAKAFKRKVVIISCSAGMTEAQLMGRLLPMGKNGSFVYVESPFVKAYREGWIILLDEMDAADSNLLLAINAALANGQIEIEARAASGLDTTVKRHEDTVILAAANTWGSGADTQYVGRGALDASTLDRFYRMDVDYDHDLEARLGDTATVAKVHFIRNLARAQKLRRVVSTRMIVRLGQAQAAGFTMAEALKDELASWTNDERSKVQHNV